MSLKVALVAGPGPEGESAAAWLESATEFQARRRGVAELEAALRESDVVWVHGPAELERTPPEAVRAFVAQGGGLVLSLQAAAWVGPLGLESVPPNDCRELVWRHLDDQWWTEEGAEERGVPQVRGLATYGPHPLVSGLHNGVCCWAPSDGEAYAWACYSGGAWPGDGRVIGVERAHRIQNPERVVAWEYGFGRGRVLCLGAFLHFAARDGSLRPRLERLAANALRAAAAEPAPGPRCWWPSPGTGASASEALVLPEPLEFDGALPSPGDDPLVLGGAVQADAPFDLAGRRGFLVGFEQQGLRELWVHPHRAIGSWTVRADGVPAVGSRIAVSPDAVSRVLETPDRRLKETAFVALEHAVLLVDYRPVRRGRESVGRGPAEIEVELSLDLRRTWPYAAGSGGNLGFRARLDGRVALVQSESDDGAAAVFASRPVTLQLEGVPASPSSLPPPPASLAPGPAVRCRLRAPLGAPLVLAVVAGADRADFDRTLRAVRRLGIGGLVRQRRQRAATVAEARVALGSDDAYLDRAFEWAKRRLDAFLADVPGVGRSLTAGYAASQPGWRDGRPGRAWFFGTDACWAGFALLAAGEYSVVRQVLRFLGDRQDVTGQVPQEATASGQFYFDALDATPLYLLLAARYLEWSGDRDFVASLWPRVERAYACGVALGGDEGLAQVVPGAAGPGARRFTLYLASLWQAAVASLAGAARTLGGGRERLAAECFARAARLTAEIESRLYDAARGGYAVEQGPPPEGRRRWSPCATQAVPLLLGSTNPVHAKRFLEALGSEAFTAPWGVRTLPVGERAFAPEAEGGGAVSPLATGWAALAEYRAGLPEAGLRHLKANVDLAFGRERGAFDEALHGLEERSLGGSPDSAAAAAMVVLPVVEGLLGARPDAPAGRLTLAPQFPEAWTRLEVRGVRCADSVYDVRLRRREGVFSVALRRTLGRGLFLTIAPRFHSLPTAVEVDGQAVRPETVGWGEGVRCAVSLEASGEHEIRYVL